MPPASLGKMLDVEQMFLPARLAKAAEIIDRRLRDNWMLYSLDYDRAIFVRPKPEHSVVLIESGFFCAER